MHTNFRTAAGTVSKLIAPTLPKNFAADYHGFFPYPLTGISF